MKKLIFFTLLIGLTVTLAFAADSTWTFNSDIEGWNSSPTTWNTTITHDGVEGHDTAGCLNNTDADGYYGVRNTVTIGAADPLYQIDAWAKIVSLPLSPATGGLTLATWDLDKDFSSGTSVAFDTYTTTTNVWQVKTQAGTAYTGHGGYIMIWGGASGQSGESHTVQWYLDDITYAESSGITDDQGVLGHVGVHIQGRPRGAEPGLGRRHLPREVNR